MHVCAIVRLLTVFRSSIDISVLGENYSRPKCSYRYRHAHDSRTVHVDGQESVGSFDGRWMCMALLLTDCLPVAIQVFQFTLFRVPYWCLNNDGPAFDQPGYHFLGLRIK